MKAGQRRQTLLRHPETDQSFTTLSGEPVQALYSPRDLAGDQDLSGPGDFPYTRGIHREMYRRKLWTIRQFAGFGVPGETNRRFKYLLDQGQTGLSVAFDLPTLMGLDSDDPLSAGEVGKCGVAVDSLRDMESLFEGIDLGRVSTSLTINAPAAIVLAMYVVVAEQQGVARDQIRGTLQNDILKEYIAQKEWIYPPRPSMRLVIDSIQFCTEELPAYNSISISGYHIREAGSTAVQELAFTLRNGIEYVEWCLRAGMEIDDFAPRLSLFFNSHNDFFEEIAKFRAARRIWARTLKERFGARSERALKCRFHAQTAGCSLTAQQPANNIVRTALQALAAVLGGTNSLHTNSYDEALALPTEESARVALRTQQIIALESGVINTVDPLGGSYFVESLTNRMEQGALEYFETIDKMNGMVSAIEAGFPQREIGEASYDYQRSLEENEKTVVGVNEFVHEEAAPLQTLKIGDEAEQYQRDGLRELRKQRDEIRVQQSLRELEAAARSPRNLMPPILDAVRAYATLGEICRTLREVFGTYTEPSF